MAILLVTNRIILPLFNMSVFFWKFENMCTRVLEICMYTYAPEISKPQSVMILRTLHL